MTSHVQLYVRAGRDGSSYGACPFCQRILMQLLMKAEAGVLDVTMTTINLNNPPDEFRHISNRIPVLIHNEHVVLDNEEIIDYIQKAFPEPALIKETKKAIDTCLDLFSRFSYFIKDVASTPKALYAELKKINTFLEENGTKYLCGDDLSDLDCFTMAKLHNIRVACETLKDFHIPKEFQSVWRYLAEAYKLDAFRKSCPPDEEIIHRWGNKLSSMGALKPEVRNVVMNTIEPDTKNFNFVLPEGIE